MEKVLEIWAEYGQLGSAALILLQMILLLITMGMIRRLSRYIKKIHKSVQGYLEVVMADAETPEEVQQTQRRTDAKKPVTEMESRQKREQQEKVFNAVLQEIFP